jgi:hypothetical protein
VRILGNVNEFCEKKRGRSVLRYVSLTTHFEAERSTGFEGGMDAGEEVISRLWGIENPLLGL